MPGTREELFEELDLWSTGHFSKDDSKRIYFLTGAAGLGKSSIAHQFCTRLDDPEKRSLGASFFFERGGGDLESTRLFFPTLAYQLATSQPQLRSRIIIAARGHHERGDLQQMRHTFEDLFRAPLLDTPIDEGPIVLVIDGLDECRERDMIPHLLRALLDLVRVLPWLQIFLTSRPEPHVLGIFTSPEARSMVYHRSLDDTVDAWEDDVARYLRETIPKIPTYTVFVQKYPDELENLVRRAGGVFIYARIAINFLDMYDDHPDEQFDLLLSSLGTGVKPLDALYLQVLKSAFPPTDSRRHERLREFLAAIVLLKRMFTPDVVALLCHGLTKDDVVSMVDRLRSVLLVGADGVVRPIHATLCEFLLDKTRCTDPLYYVNRRKGHAQLAAACFDAFSFETMTDCLKVDPIQNDTSAISLYVHYAFQHWIEHLQDAEFREELLTRLHALNSYRMPVYRRSSWLMTRNYSIYMKRLEQWLKVRNTCLFSGNMSKLLICICLLMYRRPI